MIELMAALVYLTTAALLIARVPRTTVGWVLAAIGVLFAIGGFSAVGALWARLGLVDVVAAVLLVGAATDALGGWGESVTRLAGLVFLVLVGFGLPLTALLPRTVVRETVQGADVSVWLRP
jgi:hypothetical protein